MKAMTCTAHGPPESLVLEERESRPLEPGEVRLAVHAAGVNFPDTLIIAGKYQVKPDLPFIPGAEAAGEIIEVGAEVTGFAPGDRVIRLASHGGYADESIATPPQLMRIKPAMDYVTAAGFSLTYGTTYHALVQRARLAPGETLLVLGAAGGVGLTAVEIGKLLGATVIAAASSDEKLKVTTQHGADHVINYHTEDLRERVKELTGGKGADVIYDPVGGDLFRQAMRCVAKFGRLLVIGFASGDIPEIPANIILLKEFDLVGVFWGNFSARLPKVNAENFAHMFKWFEEGKIKPHVSATYPLEDAALAMRALLERKATGKVVLTMGR